MAYDSYKTIKQIAEGYYTEKRSRFISYAIPVRTVEEVKEQLEKYRKQYYDARHVCWAYMLGPERQTFRANDDGEPSSTAGKPIEERTVDEDITVVFEYPYLNGIMRIVKEDNPAIISQKFEMDCEMTLRIRKGEAERLKNRLLKVETAYLKE